MISRFLLKTPFSKGSTLSKLTRAPTSISRPFSTTNTPDTDYNSSYIQTQDMDFDEVDAQELVEYNEKFQMGKDYYRYDDVWKIPLAKKRARKARSKARFEAYVHPAPQ